MMNTKDLSWNLFEKTGSVEAYLSYANERETKSQREDDTLGSSPYRRNNNQRG